MPRAAAAPADFPVILPPAPPVAEPPTDVAAVLKKLRDIHLFGSASLNWRNVGPRTPGYETQIQDEVYLADMYFGVEGPVLPGVPFHLEMNVPTALQGNVQLYQMYAEYDRIHRIKLQAGKFLVPFGRDNELYRPDEILTVTRPLLFASPDSLDLVVRPNSPRPLYAHSSEKASRCAPWSPARTNRLAGIEYSHSRRSSKSRLKSLSRYFSRNRLATTIFSSCSRSLRPIFPSSSRMATFCPALSSIYRDSAPSTSTPRCFRRCAEPLPSRARSGKN